MKLNKCASPDLPSEAPRGLQRRSDQFTTGGVIVAIVIRHMFNKFKHVDSSSVSPRNAVYAVFICYTLAGARSNINTT